MRRTRLAVGVLAIAALAACDPGVAPEAPAAPDAVLSTGGSALDAGAAALALESNGYLIVGKTSGLPADLADQVAAAGGVLTGTAAEIGLAFARFDDPAGAGKIKGVQYVEPDLLVSTPDAQAAAADVEPSLSGVAGAGDDEWYWPYLWGMRAINAPQAWDAGVRGAGVKVAVIDEGFDLDHSDVSFLAADAASFVCWDVVWIGGIPYLVFASPPACESPEYGAGYSAPGGYVFPPLSDPFSHGTHTSGTIAARDNGMGVIGVAPDAEILPVKVLSEYLGGGYTSWIIQGVMYAADQGADVINMSLGGTVTIGGKGTANVMRANVVAYRRAIDYAKKKGATVVVSAGNGGLDADGDGKSIIRPAEFESPLTISATAPYGLFFNPNADLDEVASYSNTGKSLVDFAAPGGDFDYPGGARIYDMVLSTGAQNSWYFSAGTSMAAPHAAGIAALIIGEAGGSLSPAQVEAEMRRRADDLGKPGNDDIYGKGRVHTGYN